MRNYPGFFLDGGQLYAPHETLKAGYTTAGHRRIVMSCESFTEWLTKIKQGDLQSTLDSDSITISHEELKRIGWQLRLNAQHEKPQYVPVNSPQFLTKAPPARWRLVMMEMNSDILDSSKKISIGSVCTSPSPKSEETRNTWLAVLEAFLFIMEMKSQVLEGRPFSSDPARATASPLPSACIDKVFNAPPVVVWLAPEPKKEPSSASGRRPGEFRGTRAAGEPPMKRSSV